jgi:hypothetical protein
MPIWFWIVAALGLIWNAYGVYQFVGTVSATQESMMAMGMTAEQAGVYTSIPFWMTGAFAVGVFGGLLGTVLLLFRNKLATPIFLASLAGYVLLYIGDITEGVFAAIGISQVVILTIVVLIAAGLAWMSLHFGRKGSLV